MTELPDTLVASHRSKDVRVSLRRGHLVLDQQVHQVGNQRECSLLSVLVVPLPRGLAVFLRGDTDRHVHKVDIAPRGRALQEDGP